MLAFSDVDSNQMPVPETSTVPSIEWSMLVLAIITMLFYAKSVVIDCDHFRRHRNRRRYRARRRPGPQQSASCSCPSDCTCVSFMPAPLPQRPRQSRRRDNTKSPLKSRGSSPDAIFTLPPTISSSSLMDLARMQDWNNLIQRCSLRIGRREARKTDADGLLPLHWACCGGVTVEAMQALVHAYPKGARKEDEEGSTALHFACHYGVRSADVLQILISAWPGALCHRDCYGRTPLWHAVQKSASVEVLTLLLRNDPSTALLPLVPTIGQRQRKVGNELTYRSMRYTKASAKLAATKGKALKTKTINTPLGLAWKQATYMNSHRQKHGGKKWDKAVLLLKAAYHHDELSRKGLSELNGGQGKCLMHAALALHTYLPPDIISVILQRFPEQAFELDGFGRLPLAVAVSSLSSSCCNKKSIIASVLELNPSAALTADEDGRLPLTLAIENGLEWDEGVDLIVQACPDAARTIDTVTGLYPFMLSASTPTSQLDYCGPVAPKRVDNNVERSEMTNQKHDSSAVAQSQHEENCHDADAARVNTIFQLLTLYPNLARPLAIKG